MIYFCLWNRQQKSTKNAAPNWDMYLAESDVVDYKSPEVQEACKQFEQYRDNDTMSLPVPDVAEKGNKLFHLCINIVYHF